MKQVFNDFKFICNCSDETIKNMGEYATKRIDVLVSEYKKPNGKLLRIEVKLKCNRCGAITIFDDYHTYLFKSRKDDYRYIQNAPHVNIQQTEGKICDYCLEFSNKCEIDECIGGNYCPNCKDKRKIEIEEILKERGLE